MSIYVFADAIQLIGTWMQRSVSYIRLALDNDSKLMDLITEEKKRKGVKRKRSNSDDTADPVGDSNSSDNEAEGEVDRKRCR